MQSSTNDGAVLLTSLKEFKLFGGNKTRRSVSDIYE